MYIGLLEIIWKIQKRKAKMKKKKKKNLQGFFNLLSELDSEYLLNKRPSKVETKYIFIIRWKYLLEIRDYKF